VRARRGCAVYYPDASAYALHHHSTFASGGRLFYMNSFRVCVIVCIRCRSFVCYRVMAQCCNCRATVWAPIRIDFSREVVWICEPCAPPEEGAYAA